MYFGVISTSESARRSAFSGSSPPFLIFRDFVRFRLDIFRITGYVMQVFFKIKTKAMHKNKEPPWSNPPLS